MLGLSVVDVDHDETGIGIALTQGWSISIWCKATFFLNGEIADASRIDALRGRVLLDFKSENVNEKLIFSDDAIINAFPKMRDATQAEAMMLRGPNSLIVVWND